MSIGKKVISSTVFLLTIKLLQRGLGLISMLVLARILTPEDFGIFAIALIVISFSEVISNMGSWQYVVRAISIDDSVVNTAWTLDITLKSLTVVLIISVSPFFSQVWDISGITIAILAMTPAIILKALANPGLFVHRRNLTYNIIFKIGVLQKVLSFVTVITLALIFKSYWAMIIGDLISAISGTLLSYYYCSYRPNLSLKRIKNQWNFSKWMLLRGYVGFFRSQLDTLIISRSFSVTDLGRFNIARELTILPASMIIQPAFEPLLASFSDAQRDINRLKSRILTTVLIISIAVSPLCVLLYSQSDSIADLLLGHKWVGTAPIIQALSPLLFVFSISGMLSSFYISTGRVKTIFFLDLAALIILAVVLFMTSDFQLSQFVWIRTFVGVVLTLLLFFYSMTTINVRCYSAIALITTPMALASFLALIINSVISSESSLSIFPFTFLLVFSYPISIYLTAIIRSRKSAPWNDVLHASNRLIKKTKLMFTKKLN